ncbi:hypothetical protein JTE90_023258, partial [Oedothorax gibbosus]
PQVLSDLSPNPRYLFSPPNCSTPLFQRHQGLFLLVHLLYRIFSETKSRPHIHLVPKCLGCQIIITTNELIVAPNGTNPKKLNVHPA